MNPPEVIALLVALMKREREVLETNAGTRSRIFYTCINGSRHSAREESPPDPGG